MSPLATSTKTSRTSLAGTDGDGDAAVGMIEGSGDDPGSAVVAGWIRNAAIVFPSGDHQKLTTVPSSSDRTLPVATSIRRTGPSGIWMSVETGCVGPSEASIRPLGSKSTEAGPNTGIECSL